MGTKVDALPPTYGLLASSGDDSLAAFRQLADDPTLRVRLGAAGLQGVKGHYSLRSTLSVLEGVIRQAAGRGAAGAFEWLHAVRPLLACQTFWFSLAQASGSNGAPPRLQGAALSPRAPLCGVLGFNAG